MELAGSDGGEFDRAAVQQALLKLGSTGWQGATGPIHWDTGCQLAAGCQRMDGPVYRTDTIDGEREKHESNGVDLGIPAVHHSSWDNTSRSCCRHCGRWIRCWNYTSLRPVSISLLRLSQGMALRFIGCSSPNQRAQRFHETVERANRALATTAVRVAQEEGPFDLLHVHDWLTSWAAFAVQLGGGTPLVATIHATERGRYQGYLHDHLSAAIDSAELEAPHAPITLSPVAAP